MAQSDDSKPNSLLRHYRKKKVEDRLVENEGLLKAELVSLRQPSEAALSEKMAKISSLRESGGPLPQPPSFTEKNKGASSLPRAMAKVHLEKRESQIRERLQGKSSSGKPDAIKPNVSADLKVEDPQPGTRKAIFWFLFGYGRFAKGVLLVQNLPVTVLFWILCGLGSIQLSVGVLSPVPGPGQVYDARFTSNVLAGGMLLGMGSYFLVSMAVFFALRRKQGGIGKLFGLKVVVNAFLPFAAVELLGLFYGSFRLGEAFWRGQVPAGYGIFTSFLYPLFWVLGFYRVGQAVTGLFSTSFSTKLFIKAGSSLIGIVPVALVASGLPDRLHGQTDRDWENLKNEILVSAAPLPAERFRRFEAGLPFHSIDRKRDLYLYRMQELYRSGELELARADALRLDRMAISGSSDDELAKGLNYLFRDRLDLAIPRFQKAIELDADCLPAHQWLALGFVGSDIDRSEKHARILMQSDPNVFHLQLLVRILFVQEKFQDIWDVMLTVDTPPDGWDPVTLYQGGVAARELGKTRRAEDLFALARSKGLETNPD